MHTIRPWLVRSEQAMNRALFADNEKGRFYVQFNIDGLMRGDYKSRMEGYAIARQNGWMSANDIRALENMNPIPDDQGGSDYLVNGNMVPISLCGIAQAVAAAKAAQEAEEQTQPESQETQPGEPEEKPKKSPQRRRKPKKKEEEQPDEQENDAGQSV